MGYNGGKDWYLKQFALAEERLSRAAGWDVRRKGIERFAAVGFPDRRDEEWRLTNLAPVTDHPFEIPSLHRAASDAGIFPPLGDAIGPDEHRLVFINGFYDEHSSRSRGLPSGMIAGHTIDSSPSGGDGFAALNDAFSQDGGVLRVPDGVDVARPIFLHFHTESTDAAIVAHPRSEVVLGEGSRLRLVEIFSGGGEIRTLTNALTRIVVGPRAVLEYYRLQTGHATTSLIATTSVRVARGGTVAMASFALDGGFTRDNLEIRLEGEGADCTIRGLSLASGARSVGHRVVIDHVAPHCSSRQIQKGIFGGSSRGLFHGTIVVRPGAQKTSASQINRNLLLSDDAVVDSKPQLEIFADDVKCNHGSATGSLDEEAIFYLRSRGIGAAAARAILTRAFADEIARAMVVDGLRNHIETRIASVCDAVPVSTEAS